MRVLIADDDSVSRQLLHRTLIKSGYEVVVACDGEQAWASLQGNKAPELVLLDWMMPGLDGLEVCRRARASANTRHVYILLVTVKGRKEDIVAALDAGADDFLTKPYDAEELRARLRAGVRIRQLHAELATQVSELEKALASVRQLHGLLPICCYCKKVRDSRDYWQEVESYVSDHSAAQFSHGVCPTCFDHVLKTELATITKSPA